MLTDPYYGKPKLIAIRKFLFFAFSSDYFVVGSGITNAVESFTRRCSLIQLSPTDVGLIVGGAGKIFIEVADSMPDPGPEAGYFTRWFYGLMQKLASNGAKAEAARSGGSVMVVAPKSEVITPEAHIKPVAKP